MKARDAIKVIGLLVVCFAGMILIFNAIFHSPVKAQKYAVPPKKIGERTPEEIAAELNDPYPIYEEHQKNLDRLPKFVPPANNHLTEDQIHSYHKVVVYCWDRYAEFEKAHVDKTDGLAKVAIIAAFGERMLKLAFVEALDMQQVTAEEHAWVGDRLNEAALFASNRKWETGKFTPEEKPFLESAREQLAFMLALDDKKTGKPSPERLEIKNIPRTNVQLFLKFKEEARWQRVNFSKIEFDEQDIMAAAQVLPE